MKSTRQIKPVNLMVVTTILMPASLFIVIAMAIYPIQAFAQSNSAALSPSFQPTSDPCKTVVSKFEQTIGFIRQSQGNQAAAELKEKLLPAKVENALLLKDGYCGLAAYLREKKLDK